ncbi:unnamed protein product [Schistosoma margrebowiei]|uniref:Uncharacterized protein n=1 Tax=Schistosoma margrebowiei TaxID=48269 RepID=A0A183MLV8_9TREM|nr:unnamed protein product [Schistosoma margrebowiei]
METLDNIQERKNEKIAINDGRAGTEKFTSKTEYTEANKQVKRSIIADKRQYVEDTAATAEKLQEKKISNNYTKERRKI